ncbi:MAG: DUF2520 domain-containing protein [candidate division WOR-3 bacterium]|nr:MAG: DUF2520 domain-containing protein [candidate division WOR-3 bacterium]
MKIGLIGCGKVGTTLCYLLKRDHRIVGVYDINKINERRTKKLLNISRNPDLETLCRESTVLFIATPDDEIVRAFQTIRPYLTGTTYIYHFSGLLPSTVFKKTRSSYRGSVHPFASFPFIIIPPQRRQYPLFIEGDEPALRTAAVLFRSVRFSITRIRRNRKRLYHLLGVFASNFLTGLLYAVRRLSRKLHVNEEVLDGAVLAIMRETLDNVNRYGLNNSLSGPLQRGDTGTVKEHLHALKNTPELLSLYRVMSLTITASVKKGKERRVLEKMLKK